MESNEKPKPKQEPEVFTPEPPQQKDPSIIPVPEKHPNKTKEKTSREKKREKSIRR